MDTRRPKGHSRYTTRSTTLELLKEILPNHIKPDRDIQSWAHFTRDKNQCEKLIKGKIRPEEFTFDESSLQPPPPPPPPSPNQSSTPPPSPPPTPRTNNDQKYYQTLGIMNTATPREITAAYRRLARTFHPDKWNKQKDFTQEEGSERFKEISNAYERIREK